MARSQETFSKQEKEKKKQRKKEEKARKREERKAAKESGAMDDMIAYVDEFGNITDTPPDPNKKKKAIKAENIVIGVPRQEEEEVESERKGKVDHFNHDKGYGFIKDSLTQESYFFHISGTIDQVDIGDKVVFELERGQKGMNAVKVRKQ